MVLEVVFGPTYSDGMFAGIFFISHLDHFHAQLQWDASLVRISSAAGSEDQLFNFRRMFQCKNLRHPSAHRMAANDCLFKLQMIEYRRSVISEHLHRIVRRRLAGLSHSTIIESDYGVIA